MVTCTNPLLPLSHTPMIDLAHAVLILILLVSNISRIIRGFHFLSGYLRGPRLRQERLVPYFGRRGQLVGMVRIPPNDPFAAPSPNVPSRIREIPPVASSRRSPVTPLNLPTPTNVSSEPWSGWPNGQFQCLLSPQQVADTDKLAINWVCEFLPGHRGSSSASTWQKGKEIHRKCIGVLECSSRFCSVDLQCAPAPRAVDLHRQLQKKCLCGERIRLRPCGIQSSTYLFSGGAFFINSGTHSHAQYTHSLIHRPHEPFEFEDYMARWSFSADASDKRMASPSSVSSEEGSEWGGIEPTEGLVNPQLSTETVIRDADDDESDDGGMDGSMEFESLDSLALAEVSDDPHAGQDD
ncbi:hypothetical protein MSAN_00147400 [Mycena sanguinolenta]|uniref:Uncharacterized protein n=1 Tax=Mycena sanguinolenta TaxID=230812 RepID=A0A8H6ZJ31_9AGAR|nr:hypothetical protein MSAN_00147400 [Mycena sanguinolenta]